MIEIPVIQASAVSTGASPFLSRGLSLGYDFVILQKLVIREFRMCSYRFPFEILLFDKVGVCFSFKGFSEFQ